MGPEDELSDEAPDTADDAVVVPTGPADSGLDFVPEDAAAADAPDEYTPDDNAPMVDLSGELAEDAGEQASYGFEAARETVKFASPGELAPDELTSIASVSDDSDKYRIHDVPGAEEAAVTDFADDAGASAATDDDAYAPPEDDGAAEDPGYASGATLSDSDDQAAPVDEDIAVADEAPAVADEAPPAVEEEEVITAPPPAEPEEDEVRAPPRRPDPKSGRAARPEPKPAARPAPAPSDDPRPGQLPKSALDEIFARAAQIKKQK